MHAVTDLFDGFDRAEFVHDRISHHYYRAGAGPAVIVIHEIPGLHPGVAAFGRRLIAAGMTVYLPSLFGEPGREVSAGYLVGAMARACVSREFATWATRKTSPIVSWLTALARDAHAACGGPGVGAIGMCLTGGFALAMMVDDTIVAPVLSQPSMPFPLGKARSRSLGLSDADLTRVKDRVANDDLCILGLRFSKDRAVPDARWKRYSEEFGDRFIGVDIDSSSGNPHGIKQTAHSVLTEHLVDEPGHPTRDGLDRVIAFFRERLAP